jgi:multimeric flavodoxin WrbA
MARKRVVALHSSRRKGNTWHLLGQVAERLGEHDVDVEIVDLFRHDIGYCVGCFRCITRGHCPLKDDVPAIMQRVTSADGLILTTPLYVYTISGRLKVFLDRTIAWIHRPEMIGRPALHVCTTMGSPVKPIEDYLDEVAMGYGMHPTGLVARKRKTMAEPVAVGEIQRFVHALQGDPATLSPTYKQLTRFAVQKALAIKVLTEDRSHWVDRGWDRAIYYHPCRIGPLKRLWAWAFYALLSRRMKRYDGEPDG